MSTHKNIDRICIAALVIAMIVTVIFMHADTAGVITASATCGYESRLFDTSKVHSIDIVMDDWDGFLETCEDEEYTTCTVVIDGDSYKNVAIRAKGNTSLSTVSQLGSDRYSLKIEFDHYNSSESYYGLDKLCLNNIIQDTTYMKDYLSYQLMAQMGVPSPLCSYAYITINGEDWGLYLAVEDVEDAFLARNYGSDHGELYKPDSQSLGGGRGNGKDFDMDDFDQDNSDDNSDMPQTAQSSDDSSRPQPPNSSDDQSSATSGDSNDRPQPPDGAQSSDTTDSSTQPSDETQDSGTTDDRPQPPDGGMPGQDGENHGPGGDDDHGPGGDGGMSMGSDDVKLQYIDDDVDSYANIFDNAKTDVTKADKKRLIASLKSLGEGTDIEDVVDTDEVIRYFVVHNFLCNGDSYTGSMVHNYYLYEKDGQLSMIPWDYNLAFGTFQSSDATEEVNTPIDTPVSGGSMDDLPMLSWIFADDTYTQLYHQYFSEFLDSVDFDTLIETTKELIAPYVEKDPTKFYTYEEFEQGVEALKTFCELRTESIEGQLNGTIPSTTDGQSADDSNLVDASELTLSDMGTMNNGEPGGDGGPGRDDKAGGGPGMDNSDSGGAENGSPGTNDSDSSDTENGSPGMDDTDSGETENAV